MDDELSPADAAEEIRRLKGARGKRVEVVVNGGSLNGAISQVVGKKKVVLSADDQRHIALFERYRRRFAVKLAGSIILEDRLYWEMHVCRFDVFEWRKHPITDKPCLVLRQTKAVHDVLRWFREEPDPARRQLCDLVREQAAEDRRARTRLKADPDFILQRMQNGDLSSNGRC